MHPGCKSVPGCKSKGGYVATERERARIISKFKATPDAFADAGPIGLEEAYKDLSRQTFAVWVRLMVATDEERKLGRKRLAKLLGYGSQRGGEVFRELKRLGYVEWIPYVGRPSELVVLRRAKIRARTHFVRVN